MRFWDSHDSVQTPPLQRNSGFREDHLMKEEITNELAFYLLTSLWYSYLADGKRVVEKLWRDFFSDPSQWWDHRAEKVSRCNICISCHSFDVHCVVRWSCSKSENVCTWIVGMPKVSRFQAQRDKCRSLAERQAESFVGGSRAGHCVIVEFTRARLFME